MTPSIFISYRHSDAAGHAGRLFDRLGHWLSDDDLFFDVHALDTGHLFPEQIGPPCVSRALPADDHTRSLLEALLERPSILVRSERFLVVGMKGLLREGWNPKLVYEVARILLGAAGSAVSDFRTSLPGIAGDLADIALTLHLLPETRTQGLDLFERMMELNALQLKERLEALDRHAFQ